MAAINTYGMKMKGLKKASSETFDLGRYNTQISYDLATGEVLSDFMAGANYLTYRDDNVITICNTSSHMTMQEIADAIHEEVERRKAYGA